MVKKDMVNLIELSLGMDIENPTFASMQINNKKMERCYDLNHCKFRAKMSLSGQYRFIEIHDNEKNAFLFWFTLPYAEKVQIKSTPLIKFLTDSSGKMTLESYVSRNLNFISQGRKESRALAGDWQKTKSGPTHMLWALHPVSDGPIIKFKDVGVDEDGGIKLRFKNYGYILFLLDRHKLSSYPWYDPSCSAADFVVMRYEKNELDIILEIGKEFLSRHG